MSYHRPETLKSALELLAQPDGLVVAGGTDVYPSVQRAQRPSYYLDVTAIDGLSEIEHSDHGTRIGASVTWGEIVRADLPAAFDGLRAAAREVGSVQIQNAGTMAGNICNASPAADGVPPLLTLDAKVELRSAARGLREVLLSDFIQGVRKTDLLADELVTAILIPPVPTDACSAFEKLGSRRYLVISITMTSAIVSCDAIGKITEARIAVGACSPVAQRLHRLEAEMVGLSADEITVTADHLADLSPIDDVRGSGPYRLDVVADQCRRALRRSMQYE